MLFKTIACLSMSLVVYKDKEGYFSLFRLLFGVASDSFHPRLALMACSGSFNFLQTTTSQNVLTCKFTINQLHVYFVTKWGSFDVL